MLFLVVTAIVPAAASLYFAVFWHWFTFWRRHRALTYTMLFGILIAAAIAIYAARDWLVAARFDPQAPIVVVGWLLIVAACTLGFVADRQIGIRVRSFAPLFDAAGRIELVTTGAYGIVRHPIYASGVYYQLGVFFVTGVYAVAGAALVLGLGALWFTRQEERRLRELLADPTEYDRYRARVPALVPWPRVTSSKVSR